MTVSSMKVSKSHHTAQKNLPSLFQNEEIAGVLFCTHVKAKAGYQT